MTINNNNYVLPSDIEGLRYEVKVLIKDSNHLLFDAITQINTLEKSLQSNQNLTDLQKKQILNQKTIQNAEEMIPKLNSMSKKCDKIFLKAIQLGVFPENEHDTIEYTTDDMINFLPVVPLKEEHSDLHTVAIENVKSMESVTTTFYKALGEVKIKVEKALKFNTILVLINNLPGDK